MIYISEKDQDRIRNKVDKLPAFFRGENFSIVFFETLGTLLLAYGICVGVYQHPIEDHKPNPTFQFLVSCVFYFAISVSAPFSGAHINPAVTLALNLIESSNKKIVYIVSQLVGGLAGASIAYGFFGVIPYAYADTDVTFWDLLRDFAGEIFGTFTFVFFIILVTQTNYMGGVYFKYFLLSIALFCGRTFTLRKGCLNPAIAFAFQLHAAIQQGNFLLFLPYVLVIVIGPITGAMLAAIFFKHFYNPLKNQLLKHQPATSPLVPKLNIRVRQQ